MNTAAESLLRDSPSRAHSIDAQRPWRLIDHEGSSVEIDSPAIQSHARQQRRVIAAIGNPLDFRAVDGVSFAELEFDAPPTANSATSARVESEAAPVHSEPPTETGSGSLSAELRHELIEMIQCWPLLAANLRAALLAIARAAK